ncbi:MAG: hypothetical protein ACM3PW_16415 [Chlamydiota bacterium]
MKYLGMFILLAVTLMAAQDTAKVYLMAIGGSYSASMDGMAMKIEANHYIEQKVLPGRHNIGYQSGYFGDWTATSLKATAGQSYYFVLSSVAGRGRTCAQVSATQGETCLRTLENRSGTEQCLPAWVNGFYPSFQQSPGNLVPWGFHTRTPR